MQQGTIKFFNESKGYGFITKDETGTDIFFHITGILDKDLREGDTVTFDEQDGKKGKMAVQVKLLDA